jgi:hypothetical protein
MVVLSVDGSAPAVQWCADSINIGARVAGGKIASGSDMVKRLIQAPTAPRLGRLPTRWRFAIGEVIGSDDEWRPLRVTYRMVCRRGPASQSSMSGRDGGQSGLDSLDPGRVSVGSPFPPVNNCVALDHVDHPPGFQVDEAGRVDRVMMPIRAQERRLIHTLNSSATCNTGLRDITTDASKLCVGSAARSTPDRGHQPTSDPAIPPSSRTANTRHAARRSRPRSSPHRRSRTHLRRAHHRIQPTTVTHRRDLLAVQVGEQLRRWRDPCTHR